MQRSDRARVHASDSGGTWLLGLRRLFLELSSPGLQLLDALWVYSALEQTATPLRPRDEISCISHLEFPDTQGTSAGKLEFRGKRPV